MVGTNKIKEAFAAPFSVKDIEWRAERSGIVNGKGWAILLAYVTNRAIQQRLDDVVGIENWKNGFTTGPEGGFMCGISVRIDNEWIEKTDGADKTNFEAVKGGFSGSMKRAAVQWGIGRYLYKLEDMFVSLTETKPTAPHLKLKVKENKDDKYGKTMYAVIPSLPDWALPEDERNQTDSARSLKEQKEVVDTVNSIMADGKPTLKQLGLIRSLAKEKGIASELIEARVKEIKTSEEASKAIKSLTGK